MLIFVLHLLCGVRSQLLWTVTFHKCDLCAALVRSALSHNDRINSTAEKNAAERNKYIYVMYECVCVCVYGYIPIGDY